MKHISSIIICLIIITATTTAQVKFTQLERAATQWSVPVAKRVVPGISDYVMTYMTLSQLIDSTETILGTRIDSMKMTTNDTLALYTSDGIFKAKIVITEVDGDPTNELQELTIDEDNKLILSINNSNVDLTPYIDIDSTVVENDYGTIIVESPANTYGVTVDSTKFFSTYAGSLKENALTFTSPLSRSVNTISIINAVADGSTKGAASFTTNDFNSSSGNISLDYANGQEATSGQDGFLSSSNWSTFNDKVGGSGTSPRIPFWSGTSTLSSDMAFYWDNSAKTLIINPSTPSDALYTHGRYYPRKNSTDNSICIGQSSGGNLTSSIGTAAESNVSIGSFSGYSLVSSAYNVNIGGYSGYSNQSGSSNMNIGTFSGSQNISGVQNVNIGTSAGYSNTGCCNVNIGGGAGKTGTSVSGCINIGFNAGLSNTTSNRGNIDNSDTTTPLIGMQFDNNRVGINTAVASLSQTLDVTGTMRLTGSDGTGTTLMMRDADGDISAGSLGSGLSISSGTLTLTETGDISAVTVSAPVTGSSLSGPIPNIGVDTTASTPSALATQHDISTKISGSGTDNYIPRFNGTTAIENSNMYDDGTNIGIGNTSPSRTLHVTGEARITDLTTDITPTVIIGADATGVLESLALSNLSISGGTTLKGTGFRVNGGGSFNSGDLNLAYGMSGTYPTWAYSAGDFTFRLPSGSSGQVLKHDGTGWAAGTDTGGTGTVTSVAISGSDFSISGSPITTSGTIALSIASGVVGATELASTTVSAGSYTNTNLTVDADGRITSASNGSGISDGDKGDITVSSSGAVWNIDTGVVGQNEIATNGVGSDELASNSVASVEIVDGSVALADLATIPANRFIGSSTGAANIYLSVGTGNEIQSNQLTATTSHYGFLSDANGSVTSFAINTTPVKVDFDTPLTGLSGTMTVSSASDNITVTAAGGYEINYGVCISGVSATRQISIAIYKGGTLQSPTNKSFFITSGDEDCASGSHIMVLNASDVIDLRIATSASETVTLTGPQLSLKRLY